MLVLESLMLALGILALALAGAGAGRRWALGRPMLALGSWRWRWPALALAGAGAGWCWDSLAPAREWMPGSNCPLASIHDNAPLFCFTPPLLSIAALRPFPVPNCRASSISCAQLPRFLCPTAALPVPKQDGELVSVWGRVCVQKDCE